MASTASPYGLRAVNRNDGMPYAGATSQFLMDRLSRLRWYLRTGPDLLRCQSSLLRCTR